MKLPLLFTTLFASLATSASAFDGGIQGRVLNAQGGPVRGATVTVTAKDEEPRAKVVTAEDGSYAISNLEPGYTVTVCCSAGVADGRGRGLQQLQPPLKQ